MKRNLDRRQFLKSSLTAIGTFFVAASPLKSLANNNPAGKSEILIDADLLYAQAKDFFYKKQYEQATGLYQQLIFHYPARYIYYDGYAKVLGAQQKLLETAELYREGWLKNPENPYFMQRLALRIYDLCMGNQKAELEFCNKYGESLLFETSARLLLQANQIKPQEDGFCLSLQDILQGVKKKNDSLLRQDITPVDFSQELQEEIKIIVAQHENKWTASRTPHKPKPVEDIDNQLDKVNNRSRRGFHDQKEKKAFDKSMQKARKSYKKQAMEDGLKLKNANKVERYTMAILEEDLHDTDTIGKARKYYKKAGSYDRIINLNRYLYLKEDSPANSLALAGSLTRYGKSTNNFNEAKQLLAALTPYIENAPSVYAANYYISSAQAYARTKDMETAKKFIIQGLAQFNENNIGTSYVLLEQYALLIHTNNKKSAGIDILKTLSKKETLTIAKKKRTFADDPVWEYVDNYLKKTGDKDLNPAEQLKPLNALLKTQNGKSGDYNKIMKEINEIKKQMIRSDE